MASVIAFDVNETLLDLRALDEPFEVLLGSASLRPQWFSMMLQLAFTGGLTGRYVDFTSAQRAALAMLAEREGVPVTAGDIDGLVSRMSSLPPHPEVPGALASLARTRLRLVALTNSVQHIAEAQLASAASPAFPGCALCRCHWPPQARAAALPRGRGALRRTHRRGAPGGRPFLGHRRGHGRRMPGCICRPSRHGAESTRGPAWYYRPGPGRGSRADHQHRRLNRPPPRPEPTSRRSGTHGYPPARMARWHVTINARHRLPPTRARITPIISAVCGPG